MGRELAYLIGRVAFVIACCVALVTPTVVSPARSSSAGFLDEEKNCGNDLPPIEHRMDRKAPGIPLDVMFVLDDIPADLAATFARLAAESYEPLGIDLRPHFMTVSFRADRKEGPMGVPTADVDRIIGSTKRLFDGERPLGYDVVHTITSKDIYLERGDAVGLGGTADCVGGIRYPTRAFSVSEGWHHDGREDSAGHETVARLISHEIGHLVGARHEHANCLEGPDRQKCTVMTNASIWFLGSRTFGTLEGTVVRAYVYEYSRR
jgi:hypothetical protein